LIDCSFHHIPWSQGISIKSIPSGGEGIYHIHIPSYHGIYTIDHGMEHPRFCSILYMYSMLMLLHCYIASIGCYSYSHFCIVIPFLTFKPCVGPKIELS